MSVAERIGLPQLADWGRRAWTVVKRTTARFLAIDGMDWAAAFSFNAFFSLFPLMILLVTIASIFIEPREAGQMAIGYLGGYVPIDGEMRAKVFEVISGVLESRTKASVVALAMLVWTSLQCFTTLISVSNTAWGYEPYKWWRLPFKSLALLALASVPALLAMALPAVGKLVQEAIFPDSDFRSWSYTVMIALLPLGLSFMSLAVFYKLAPQQRVPWKEVWVGALCTAVLLRVAQSIFLVYLTRFAALNALYGAFGGAMALLLWIYVSGCILIFGATLCAAQIEPAAQLEAPTGQRKRKKGSGRR